MSATPDKDTPDISISISSVSSPDLSDTAKPTQWIMDTVLNNSGFGSVMLWIRLGKVREKAVLKQCRFWDNDDVMIGDRRTRWLKEIDTMVYLDHMNVLATMPVPDEMPLEVPDVVLVTEYCSGGNLRHQLMQAENCCGLREDQVRLLLDHVTGGLQYLHSNRIIHRDLKPENILLHLTLDNKVVYKISNLGFAKDFGVESGTVTSLITSYQYVAPELLVNLPSVSFTVDFWSFGLVAHEAVTGVRPFLPSLSPSKWMSIIKKKSREHICAYMDSKGEVMFSQTFVPENRISRVFASKLESWLQVMLDWNPLYRGYDLSNNEMIAFSMVKTALRTKVVNIVNLVSHSLHSFEVEDPHTSHSKLTHTICNELGMSSTDAIFLTMDGTVPDATKLVFPPIEVLNQNGGHQNLTLFAFPYQPDDVIKKSRPKFPLLVEIMFRDSRRKFEYADRKRMWCHTVFFISREMEICERVLSSIVALTSYILSQNQQMFKTANGLAAETLNLESTVNFYLNSSEYDLERILEQNSRTSQESKSVHLDLVAKWKANSRDLIHRIDLVKSKVASLGARATLVNAKIQELARNDYHKKLSSQAAFQRIWNSCLESFDTLRLTPPEERPIFRDNTEILRIVVEFLRTREQHLTDIYGHMAMLLNYRTELDQVRPRLLSNVGEISALSKSVSALQMARQRDIWDFVEGSTFLSGEMIKQVKSELSSELPNDKKFAELLAWSSDEATKILAENEMNMKILRGVVESMDDCLGCIHSSSR